MSEFCPRCGNARVGAFRFCRQCRFDYDVVAPEPTAVAQPIDQPVSRRPVRGRLTGRQWLGTGAAIFVGLAVLGSLMNPKGSTAGTAAAATPMSTSRIAAVSPTPAPSYWA